MSLNDPIGDMIARIKNAQLRNHKKVELPSSNFKIKIAEVLKNEGYIKDYEVLSEENKFKLIDTQPIDMFPHTPHIECIATLRIS